MTALTYIVESWPERPLDPAHWIIEREPTTQRIIGIQTRIPADSEPINAGLSSPFHDGRKAGDQGAVPAHVQQARNALSKP